MATFDYTAIQRNADSLIKRFGQAATLRRTTEGTKNRVAGTITGATSTDYTIRSVTLPASSSRTSMLDDSYKEELIGGRIKFVLVSAKDLSVTPKQGDHFVLNSETWEVMGATSLAPGGTNVLFKMFIRKR